MHLTSQNIQQEWGGFGEGFKNGFDQDCEDGAGKDGDYFVGYVGGIVRGDADNTNDGDNGDGV